jgi:Ca2+-binding RTX toxin-like protein
VISFDFSPATDVRCGNDVVAGGAGNDLMWGDFGAIHGNLPAIVTSGTDRFVLTNGSDHDTIFDFENDKDVIDLKGYAGIAGFGQIVAGAAGADVVIDLGLSAGNAAGADVLTLANFSLGDLNAADFDFN